jgi:hypothetical protein
MLLEFGDDFSDDREFVKAIDIGISTEIFANSESSDKAGNLSSDGRIVSGALKLEKAIGPTSVVLREGFFLAHV